MPKEALCQVNTRCMIRKMILPLLLVFAFLMPTGAYAASPDIPAFDGRAVIELNGYVPVFSAEDIAAEDYIVYSELDELGRPGPAAAFISGEALSKELRGESGDYLPVGWKTARYDDVISERYLWFTSVGMISLILLSTTVNISKYEMRMCTSSPGSTFPTITSNTLPVS